MTTKTKSKLSFKKLLDETERTQYVMDEVVAEIEPSEAQEIEFVNIGEYVSASHLEEVLEKRGYELAHPYALALYAKEHPDFADGKSIATQWKDKQGNFCYATFGDWDGIRSVRVIRRSSEWRDGWRVACLRKHPALESSGSLDLGSQKNEELEKAIEVCKAAGLVIFRPV